MALGTGATGAQGNLVVNPGFETVREGAPEAWGTENWNLGGKCALDEAVAHAGRQSVRVACDTDANRAIWRQIVPFQGPACARLSARYRTEIAARANGRGAVIRLILFKDAGKWQELGLPTYWGPPSDGRWSELAVTFYVPAEATAVGIELFNMDAAGTVWWDDIMLRKATETEERQAAAEALESAPAPYTVRYAPAEGSTSALDPPAFVWLPVGGTKEYTLQYSRDPGFPPAATGSVACDKTIYVPRRTLGSGKWHWRFGVPVEGRITFSRARSFTIADDAVPVPFPDVKAVIARLDGVRPRDFVRPEDLRRLRALGEGALKEHLAGMKRNARRYLGEPLLPEPAFLPQGGQERAVAYTQTFRTTRPFNGGMVACATVYLLSGDEEYGQEARRRLMHLASWDPNGSTCLSHNDEPGTELVRVMPRVYDWVYPLLSEEEKRKCREVLAVRIPQVYAVLKGKPFEVRPYESHAMDYYIGDLLESCLCMAGELPVEEMLEYVLSQLWSPFFPPYGGDAGGWCEGPSYWQWSTATFLRNFHLVQQNCGVDLTRKPWLRNTPFFKLYCNPPYAAMSPFGDGQSSRAGGGDTMYKLGVVLDNPYALWFAAQQRARPGGIERFLYYLEEDAGKPPTDLPQARCFEDVGLACLHSNLADGANNVQFLLRSCPFGAISHAYADQNAFALHAYGEPLAIASGYYPYYNSPHHSSWSWETKAANSILVDGQGQVKRNWDSKGRIVRFATNDVAHYALGDAAAAYGGRLTRFLRHALFLRPADPADEPVVVLFDDVAGGARSTHEWLLHSVEPMQIEDGAQKVTIRRNAARLQVRFLAPAGLKLSQSDQFTTPPESDRMPNQWHLTARAADLAEARRFVTVLLPYREGRESGIATTRLLDAPGWVVLEVATENTRHVVAFRAGAAPGSPLPIAGVKTSADVFAGAWGRDGKAKGVLEVREGR